MPGTVSEPNRDLLFGLIALQNGLIDQKRLVSAFQTWTHDKSRPIAEVLITQGALDQDDRTAIEALVARHCNRHGGDSARSLTALHAGWSTHRLLNSLGDSDLDTSLTLVPVSGSSDDGAFVTRVAIGQSTSSGLRFQILRPLARGGLGAVFVARDDELHREVALKQILDHHADDPVSRQRFLIEAEITGGLEHPGIVPVYGLGRYSDGRPYYAMRFIRGDSLKEVIARFHSESRAGSRDLELRKLLRRFLDVCNAVDYAHARGVLHRDIKPANIIIGNYGETLVVDWGLAKARGQAGPESSERPLAPASASGSAETLPGSAMGTPAFMSPEQARGEIDRLEPRSDVYSLGATLYQVLVGRPPYQGEVEEILRAVHTGDFPAPRSLDPTIDAALEAICLKAMAPRPDDRHASSKALADDIERWLADEPVTAWREPFSRRARRWMKRNRTAVTATAASVLVALVGLAVVLAVETRANANLVRANARVKAANVELSSSIERERQRFDLARDAIRLFTDGVREDETLRNPGLAGLRAKLLERSRQFYPKLEALLQGQPDRLSQSRLALSYCDLGIITYDIGDGTEALAAYRRAQANWQRLVDSDPGDVDSQRWLAKLHGNVGLLSSTLGDRTQAMTAYQNGLAILERLSRAHPEESEIQDERAAVLSNIGLLQSETGDRTRSLATNREALAIRERLVEANPEVAEYQSHLAESLVNIGSLLSQLGDPGESLASWRRAEAIWQRLVDADPSVDDYQGRLALIKSNIGIRLLNAGDPAGALASLRQSLALRERLARDQSAVTAFQSDLADSHNRISLVLNATDDPAGALASIELALAIQQPLVQSNPKVTSFRGDLGGMLNNKANALARLGRWPEVRSTLIQAIEHQREAMRRDPRNPTYSQFLRTHLRNLLGACLTLGLPDEAAAAAREFATVAEGNPEVLYGAASFSAQCIAAARDSSAATRYADDAVESLTKAVAAGWDDAPYLSADPNLAALHDRDDFRALVARLFDRIFPADPFAR